jgi:hypothetical protein
MLRNISECRCVSRNKGNKEALNMKRANRVLAAFVGVILFSMAGVALAAPPERWLHVKVIDSAGGETVRVNVPLSLAEKILPTINHGNLHNGRVTCGGIELNGLDLRAIFEAVKDTPDNEFVTVQGRDEDVRVAKQAGNFVVHVHQADKSKEKQEVDVIVPMAVVQALISSGTKELDLVAAIRALKEMGDATLVTVHDGTNNVRVWIDARNTSE